MIQLSHQVNNKPLYIALGMAFVLHFIFTLTYHIDFEGTSPKSNVLNITLTTPPTVSPPTATPPTRMAVIEPQPIKPGTEVKAEPETSKTDYLASEHWVIAKKVTTAEYVQKIFVDTPHDTMQPALSLNLFVLRDLVEPPAISCTNGIKNYVFIECPADSLKLAAIDIGDIDTTMKPLLVMPPSRAPQLSLSTPTNPQWYNEVARPYEEWTHLAGLPTLSVAIY